MKQIVIYLPKNGKIQVTIFGLEKQLTRYWKGNV